MSTSYEIDFLPIGNDEQSGDAICMRYGSRGSYRILVYGGGGEDAGMALVKHIHEHYRTDAIDDVVCPHPDPDHAAGLSVVLENMTVLTLWMHRPWIHSPVIDRYVQDREAPDHPMPAEVRAMSATHALEVLAARKGIRLREPFQGDVLGEFLILSPDRNWYVEQLEQLTAKFEHPQNSKGPRISSAELRPKAVESARQAARDTAGSRGVETPHGDARTSFENDSSAVLFGMPADRGVLLTGDAGVRALTKAIEFAKACGISIRQALKFMQIPHHGSRHNVSPSVLDELIGPKMATLATKERITAFASTAKRSAYPHEAVVNAFIQRGAKVVATNGTHICHYFNMDGRTGWKPASPLGFSGDMDQ